MTFPRTRRGKLGYDIDEVEDFLEEARQAYQVGAQGGASTLTSAQIRQIAFTMRKDGYSAAAVDAALERLEDAFATREKDAAVSAQGEQAWFGQARSTAQVLLDRLVRPHTQRFARVGILTQGYSVREVDAFADRIADYFMKGTPITIEQIRTAAFSAQRGGYREAQVDAVLDAVVQVMLAVR